MKVNQPLTLEEQQYFLSRFFIAARNLSDIDLPGYFGTCELSIVLKSLFIADGNPHKCTDKLRLQIKFTIFKYLEYQMTYLLTENVMKTTSLSFSMV